MSRAYITEDEIETSILDALKNNDLGYNILKLDPSQNNWDTLSDGTDRSDKKQCVLPLVLWNSLKKLNPDIEEKYLKQVYETLIKDYTETDINQTNYDLYIKIRDGIKITFTNKEGVEDFLFVKLVDFNNPENNDFTAVSQMWIKGKFNWRRPDIVLFVNGMPFVFVELKNSTRKVEEAYEDNLNSYKKDIPNLFAFNQICVLSNGLETRLGAFNASYDFFFEWNKVESEEEIIDREQLHKESSFIYYFVRGLLQKDKLIDYIENFIMFDNGKKLSKIIAKNHQYIGVNNLMKSLNNRKELNGKLGVFWHTQGSGKSYSMVYFVRKVIRKVNGNFSFLIVTDRNDLDTQIYKTFIRCGVIGSKEECKPADSKKLREYLRSNKPFIFTLIDKFRWDKNNNTKYPLLTDRDDVIVLVDEAHRSQYAYLAENMRKALPNANFVAFTGTPLLGTKRLTNQWFGNYVSIYDFKQAVDDGATVPLYYSRRVPEVGLKNDFLDDDIVDIIENNDLNEKEATLVEDSHSTILEVIKREDRLKKIAKDIAHHFPRRGYLGKGLVVCVDRYTAVKMYDFVKYYWEEEKLSLITERNRAKSPEEKASLNKAFEYMNNIKMAVVISEDGKDDKFTSRGLDIQKHRAEMARVDENGLDIEDRFKDPENPLSLVFVCSMWLTGFDVKNLSTIYLDKPMKSHSLMQTIARANRVSPGKECGLIIDYINIFSHMKKALSDYAIGDGRDELPVKNIEELIQHLDSSIYEADSLLLNYGYDLEMLIAEEDTESKLERLREIYNGLIPNKEVCDKFKVITNLMHKIYQACKPEIFETEWENLKYAPLIYLNGLFTNSINDKKIDKARKQLSIVLDSSVSAQESKETKTNIIVNGEKVIDLSKIDFDKLKQEFRKVKYKAVQIEELKVYVEKLLKQMINRNQTRRKFSERYQSLIDSYNSGSNEAEYYFEELTKLLHDLKDEQNRHAIEGLTEDELEIYDLLLIEDKNLVQEDLQKVKLAAKNLYKKLVDNRNTLFVIDWFKDYNTTLKLENAVSDSLDKDLPESYDKELFKSKTKLLMSVFIDKAVQGLKVA
ncbi:type I restriction endonuclease subunit R [Mycoplasmopsis felifaucium]|uniref:Type I restriction enzyme endonuclease subunit n=1 Tax=Mycoplasmopsis felifaucium TaxID=35768 RepID=A0ABZ2RSD0_9BACT